MAAASYLERPRIAYVYCLVLLQMSRSVVHWSSVQVDEMLSKVETLRILSLTIQPKITRRRWVDETKGSTE